MSKWYGNLFAYKLNNKVSEQDIRKVEDHKIREIGQSEKEVSVTLSRKEEITSPNPHGDDDYATPK